ncbi:yip1d-interacting factor 1 isoform X2 [Rhodnius prolixus]|uniref:yip1d-interacting factor 1 isoform X2 n=1 Tax=Rhodnius prolixus TaxID=13249 RepID=UPI003D18F28E
MGPYGDNPVANEYLTGQDESQMVNTENASSILRKHVQERGFRGDGPSSHYPLQQGYGYGIPNNGAQDFYRPNEQINQNQSFMQHAFGKDQPFPGHPLMTDMAFVYGSKIVDTGKEIVDKELNKYVSLSRIKRYFAVDTNYTIKKLRLILFPFNNVIWSPKMFRGQPALPKEDVNAPDLYIPLMAYITYVLLGGYVIGKHNGFSPEVLGVLATQALGHLLIELAVQLITMYITNLQTSLSTWDLVAFSGYKFVGIIVALLMKMLLNQLGYYLSILYCGISLAFFTVRSLKWRMVNEKMDEYNSDLNGDVSPYSSGMYQSKRRLYFLLLVGVSQPVLMWWHSYNLERYNYSLNST